mmetsp:Transcript_27410/g.91686  ORF Transcript_27410/g.91686 Transcript_27410/m.91686 type:complete len:101 (+) Transcript_27410:128-430(+)
MDHPDAAHTNVYGTMPMGARRARASLGCLKCAHRRLLQPSASARPERAALLHIMARHGKLCTTLEEAPARSAACLRWSHETVPASSAGVSHVVVPSAALR